MYKVYKEVIKDNHLQLDAVGEAYVEQYREESDKRRAIINAREVGFDTTHLKGVDPSDLHRFLLKRTGSE